MVASHHVQTKYRVTIVPSDASYGGPQTCLPTKSDVCSNVIGDGLNYWVEKVKRKKKKETLGKSAKMTGRRRACECLICSVPRGASSQPASTRGRSQPIGIILRRVQEARKQEKKKKKKLGLLSIITGLRKQRIYIYSNVVLGCNVVFFLLL